MLSASTLQVVPLYQKMTCEAAQLDVHILGVRASKWANLVPFCLPCAQLPNETSLAVFA